MASLESESEHRQRRLTRRTKTLVICIYGTRFMARTSDKQGARHDFVRRDVRRNAPQQSKEMVEISRSMNNAVHLDRVTANNVKNQV